MRLTIRFRRDLVLLLVLVAIFSALAPTASRLLASAQNIEWVEICTPKGTQLVASTSGAQKPSEAVFNKRDHCAYCLLQEHSPVLTSSAVHAAFTATGSNRIAVGGNRTSIVKRFVRDAHRTRAPPPLSPYLA